MAEMIPEAAKHGSYVWLLDALSTDPAQVVPLAKANPQTAFGLLADPAALTEDCVAALAACRNLVVMPLLNTPELTPEACRAARRMKAQKMFYALTVLVDDDTVDEVMQDDWLESIAQETLFCVCARKNAPGSPWRMQAVLPFCASCASACSGAAASVTSAPVCAASHFV